jgi:RNA polymerase sigma-70 factor (ECF subfamily)
MEQLVLVTENRSDLDLVSACRSGNRDAMRRLYEQNQRRVFSIALHFFGGDVDRASDVTQQVFLKLFGKMDFRGDSALTTWLYRMTINQCIDEQRRSRRLLNLEDWFPLAEPVTKLSLADQVQSDEIAAEVQKVIASLRPKLRIPIVLKYVEGLSYQQIADVLKCSIGTVSSRLNRGHKLLATKLAHLKNEI